MTALLTERTYAVAWDDPAELEGAGIPGGPLRARLQKDPTTGRLTRWNGFVCPHFERSEIERYIAFVDAASTEGADYDRAEFDGDVLVVSDPYYMQDAANGGEPYTPDRMGPTEAGLYPLGAFGWTWCIWPDDGDSYRDLTQDECDDLGVDGRDGTGTYRWADL